MGDCLPKGSLCFALLELRLAEYALIEQKIKDYLSKADVEYDRLNEDERLAILIGAKLAIDNAIFNAVLKSGSSKDDGFDDQFESFLKTIVPIHEYYETLTWIENNTQGELSKSIERRFIEEGGYPKHEAYLRVLSMVITSYIVPVETDYEEPNRVWEALYCCYLHAKQDYFQGNRE